MSLRSAWLALLLVLPGPDLAQDPATVAHEVLQSGDYQTELPGRREPVGRSDPGARRERAERDRPEGDVNGGRPRREGDGVPITLGDGAGLLLWVVLGAAAAVLLASLLAGVRGRHRDVALERAPAKEASSTPVTASFQPVDEAERLARDGRYGEAIRLLLYHALQAVSRGGALRIAPSWTSREVLHAAKLPAGAGAHLRALIDAEERSLFARRPAALADYQACAAQYRALVRAGRAGDA